MKAYPYERVAASLSYDEYFDVTKQNYNGAGRENVRHKELVKHFQEEAHKSKGRICYIDQMACTTIIATHYKKYGYEKTSLIMRDGFSQRDKRFFPESAQTAVDQKVESWIGEIDKKSKAKEPLVILHIRFSSKANKEQNFPDDFISKLIKMLTEQAKYQVCVVLADDRQSSYKLQKEVKIIEPFKSKDLFISGIDYSKL